MPFWYQQLVATVNVPRCRSRELKWRSLCSGRMDGCRKLQLSTLLSWCIYGTCARTRTCYPNVPIDRCVTPSALTVLSAKSDEETSDGLDGQDASRPLSVYGEAVPGGEQAPTQGRPPRRSAPDLSAVREGDLSDRLHQQDDRGTGVPSVQGPR